MDQIVQLGSRIFRDSGVVSRKNAFLFSSKKNTAGLFWIDPIEPPCYHLLMTSLLLLTPTMSTFLPKEKMDSIILQQIPALHWEDED